MANLTNDEWQRALAAVSVPWQQPTPVERQTGIVKWWDKLLGYGFIIPDDGGPDRFVHYSSIEGEGNYHNLHKDQRVSFVPVDNGKGPAAVQVRPGRGS